MTPLRASHVTYYAGIVTLSVAIAATIGYELISHEMFAANDFFLDEESTEVLQLLANSRAGSPPEKLQEKLAEHVEGEPDVFYLQVYSPAGRILFHSDNLGENRLPLPANNSSKLTAQVPGLGLMRVAEYVTPAGHLQVAITLKNFQRVNERFLLVMLGGLPLIALLSVAIGLRLRRSTLKPVRLMQAAASHITASNLSERIPVPSGDSEMASLARLLNQMFDRLENSFQEIKRFTADTSHELLTPLSVIRLHAERMRDQPQLPDSVRNSLDEQLQEVTHLTETLEKLKVLTKADASALLLKRELSATDQFIASFAEDAQMLAEHQGCRFVLGRNERAQAGFDHGWLRQVLLNFLSNALRFTPSQGTITLNSSHVDNQWRVEVWDEGPGVPPERIGELFQRFTQLHTAAEPRAGSGLGLAICKSIIELHRGKIAGYNRTDRSGFVVIFAIPTSDSVG
jgi:signal transduction histidine kinase